MATSWKCRIGWHKWQNAWNEAGQRYQHCARCGRDDDKASGIRAVGG
jgi:hypothetical protein